jgi:hypothetical protein
MVSQEKGHSTVKCPDIKHDWDVFIPKAACDPRLLTVGPTVAFRAKLEHDGMWRAQEPLWTLASENPDNELVPFAGTIGNVVRRTENGVQVESPWLPSKIALGSERLVKICDLEIGDRINFTYCTHNGETLLNLKPLWKCFVKTRVEKGSSAADAVPDVGSATSKAVPPVAPGAQKRLDKFHGYLKAGNNIDSGTMTLEVAKQKAMELPNCAGFTFKGEDTGSLKVWFSSKWEFAPQAGWTAYRRVDKVAQDEDDHTHDEFMPDSMVGVAPVEAQAPPKPKLIAHLKDMAAPT